MKIRAPELIRRGENVEYHVEVQSLDMPEELWYSVDEQYGGLLSDRADAALVALLIPAMEAGEEIHVRGTISRRLYYTLTRSYQAVLQEVLPSLKWVQICPEDVQSASEQASGVATGFSAGIDSFSVLADHHYADEVPSGFRLTHLLYNNVGSHGSGGEHLFRKRYARLRPIAESIGLPFIAVNSNLDSFYKNWRFQPTHTPRNMSVALLLQSGIGRFLYGSTYSYTDVYVGKTDDIAHSDPVSLPLLSTRALDALAVGSKYTRPEKTLQVAEIDDSCQSLDVCIHPGSARNCSTCRKCRRTLLTLEIAGMLDRYEHVFDLETYKNGRGHYISEVLQSDSPFAREIVDFAEERSFTFPMFARMKALFLKAKHNLSRLDPVRGMKRLSRRALPGRALVKVREHLASSWINEKTH